MKKRERALGVAGLVVLLLATACSSSTKSSTTTSTVTTASTASTPNSTSTTSNGTSALDAVLGAKNPAAGAPVLVGIISTGNTDTISNQIEVDVTKAVVGWANDRKGGVAGRPIELVTCLDAADPGKAADCANELISKNVVAVLIGSSAYAGNEWQPLHDAHIPVVAYAATGKLVLDPDSTFAIASSPSNLLALPLAAAKEVGTKKITAMVIDVPAATDTYVKAKPVLQAQGYQLNIVRIAIGTPDMTPQANQIMSGGDPGVLNVIGNDTFCIAAFNAMRAVGFKGIVTTVAPCISDATRKAVPADFLKGIRLTYSAPVGSTTGASYDLYKAITDTYGGGTSIDLSRATGWDMFTTATGLVAGLEGMTGDVTPATVIAKMKSMPWTELPGADGLHFRCNGKADPPNPAVCMTGSLQGSLDQHGNPTSFTKIGDTPIPD